MKYLCLLVTLFISFASYSQNKDLNHVDLFLAYNQIDSLISNDNIDQAQKIYETKKQEGYYIQSWRQFQYIDQLYYNQGQVDQARNELLETVEKGMINWHHLSKSDSVFLAQIEDRYGKETKEKAIAINIALTNRVRSKYAGIIDELIELNTIDQQLYRDEWYSKCRSYWYRETYGYPRIDSIINHADAIAGYWEFRHQDSLKTERYIRIVDSLGFVPDERITGGLTGNTIFVHASKFKTLSVDLNVIFRNSVRVGSLSPHNYAWFKGYYDERHLNEHTFYYTVGRETLEKMPASERVIIDQRRRKIGLRPCPAVVWNNNIY